MGDPRLILGLMELAALELAAEQQSLPAGLPIPQTPDALWSLVAETWSVRLPRTRVCPQHCAPFDAFSAAYFAHTSGESLLIWEASRGLGGKSFLLSLLGLTIACTRGGDVNILGGSGEQSKRVHDYMVKAWDAPQAPRYLLRSDPTGMRTRLTQGRAITCLVASSTSVRGGHPSTLLLDEIDEMDLAIFDAAMGQTMEINGIPPVTVCSSTHHYPDGTMTELKRRAQEKKFPYFPWCYKESIAPPHGWLTEATVAQKRRETTAVMWDTEYELQEPSPTDRAILPQAVTYMFQREIGEYEGRERESIEVEAPVPGATYAHGADWAKNVDFTEIITLRTDVIPARLVAYERMQRLPWPQMVKRFEDRIARYGPDQSSACHDGTGLGDVVDGYLTVSAEKIILVGRPRSDLFSEYISAIERGAIIAPFIKALESQHRFATIGDLYGAGHPPDGFVAGAMAWHAARLGPVQSW